MDWQQIVLFGILGLGAGSLIAGIAVGIVVTFRGSGIINLATGAVAMVAGYSYWSLKTGTYGVHVPTAPALVITFLVLLALGLLVEFAVFRPLRTAAPLAKLAASLGLLLVAQAAVSLAFGIGTKPQPPVLPGGTVTVFGSNVPIDRFILPGIILAATAALSLAYRLSRFGLATRAASENEIAAMLMRLSPNRLALASTLLGTLVAGGLGVLAASITQLDPTALPLQVVPALTAALFARFTSGCSSSC
jgi:branched-chain amino acid transport system permease protein